MYLLAAISIGLFGSLHCAGMCGPILFTVNRGGNDWRNDLLHHGGRFLSYATFGAIGGAIGHSFDLMGCQQAFSLIIGSLAVLSAILIPLGRSLRVVEQILGRIVIRISGWIHASGLSREKIRFLMGVANGLLPCGMVYLALAGAANTFTPWDGALFMLAFGLGTLPVLLAVSKLKYSLSPALRSKFRKIIPAIVLLMGLLLVTRGLNLGIPFISPQQNVELGQIINCH